MTLEELKNPGVQQNALGSVEGKLFTISEQGTFRLVIYEALSERRIDCYVPSETFKEAHAAVGRRVSVFGDITYDSDGQPVSVKANTMRVLKDLADFPPVGFFRGILKNA